MNSWSSRVRALRTACSIANNLNEAPGIHFEVDYTNLTLLKKMGDQVLKVIDPLTRTVKEETK
jgi:hypothetical protein